MPGSLISHPPCSTGFFDGDVAGASRSTAAVRATGAAECFRPLLPELYASVDYAKGRSTGAFFRAADGTNFLFVTGSE